jgi:Right handed beta helix region
MLRFTPITAAAVVTLTFLAVAPAKANTIPVTYVSGKGTDSGDCSSPVKPCRTFQFAVNQTAPGGEVKALDPADYSPVTINKSISITGVDGSGIDTHGGAGITFSLPPGPVTSRTINLVNLLIQNVSGSGTVGINVGTAQSVTIARCAVRGFSTGIDVSSFRGFFRNAFLIADTKVTNNETGIRASFAQGTLDHVRAFENSDGVVVSNFAIVTAVDTVVSNNSGNGFDIAGPRAAFLLAHSTATNNGTGVFIFTGLEGTAESFGDNHIAGNGTDVKGTLTKVGTQ